MNRTYLLLGSNIGDAAAHIQYATDRIAQNVGKITKASSFYITEPWGGISQDNFYNIVLQVETKLEAQEVLKKILEIEIEAGRERKEKYGPRIIDIDIIFFNQEIINRSGLTVPHPLLQERKFTLVPLSEIDPKFKHPVFAKTMSTLLQECKDKQDVIKKDETVKY